MADFGRVHCIVVATKAGEVVYERFYDRFTELDKAEIRAAFQQATDNVNLASDNQDFVGTFRYACFVTSSSTSTAAAAAAALAFAAAAAPAPHALREAAEK
jgi:hypothetical protein